MIYAYDVPVAFELQHAVHETRQYVLRSFHKNGPKSD